MNDTRLRLILWKANKAFEKLDRASISGTGLGLSEFAILEVLLHKGPSTIGTIGEKVLLTSGSMTAAIRRLESRDLVTRIQDPSDGRCFYVHLTRTGRKVIEKAFREHRDNLESAAAVLDATEQQQLIELLKKVGIHAERIARDL